MILFVIIKGIEYIDESVTARELAAASTIKVESNGKLEFDLLPIDTFKIFIDPVNHCQYLVNVEMGMTTPRMDSTGYQICIDIGVENKPLH